MSDAIHTYWEQRLGALKTALEANHFEVFLADSADAAKTTVIEEILPGLGAKIIAWGGSVTLGAVGLCDYFRGNKDYEVIESSDRSLPPEERMERKRQSLLSDLFLTGTNAVTEEGHLVNLDMNGNRVGAITFGPKHVILLIGRNKLVPDLEEAMLRIKTYVAPVNAMRLGAKTPCAKTGVCADCKGPGRICNVWTITEKSLPKGRIKIVLINEDLGY